jgi:hypothetical protein
MLEVAVQLPPLDVSEQHILPISVDHTESARPPAPALHVLV